MITLPKPPRLYIEEWMEAVGLDRKRLAQRMGVSAGTITKKLAKPENIDGEWLARFAPALERANPLDLFRDPKVPATSPEAALRSALLAFGVDRDEIDQVLRVVRTYVHDDDAGDETEEQTSREGRARRASRHREPAP